MNFNQYKAAVNSAQKVEAATRKALEKLVANGNMRALAVLAMVSVPLKPFATSAGSIAGGIEEIPAEVLPYIRSAFNGGTRVWRGTGKRRAKKTRRAQSAKVIHAGRSRAKNSANAAKVKKLLDQGKSNGQILAKVPGATIQTIAAIKAHRTRKKNGVSTVKKRRGRKKQ